MSLTRRPSRPVYIFFGGVVQILGAIGEWLLGNTYACALFFTYGEFSPCCEAVLGMQRHMSSVMMTDHRRRHILARSWLWHDPLVRNWHQLFSHWRQLGGSSYSRILRHYRYAILGLPRPFMSRLTFCYSTGFFYVFLGVVSLVYLVCAIRTNLCLVIGLVLLLLDVGFFTGIYWNLANGHLQLASRMQTVRFALTRTRRPLAHVHSYD